MKAALIILAALLALLHPWAALACVLAVIAALGWLIGRAARGYPYITILPWRTS